MQALFYILKMLIEKSSWTDIFCQISSQQSGKNMYFFHLNSEFLKKFLKTTKTQGKLAED